MSEDLEPVDLQDVYEVPDSGETEEDQTPPNAVRPEFVDYQDAQ